jgi:hypothetical protein
VTQGGGLDLRIEITDLDKGARKAKAGADSVIRRGLHRSALAVQREQQLLAPVDEGRLRADIDVEMDSGAIPTWAKIGTKVFYAKFVELGTGLFGPLHRLIRPVNAKVLAFAVGGQMLFRRSVKGSRAQPFIAPSLPAALPQIGRIWQDVGREIGKRLSVG